MTIRNWVKSNAKLKEKFEKRIHGWLPKEPKLPSGYSINPSSKDKDSILDKPISQLSPDTVLGWTLGFLLILVGVVGFIFNDWAVAAVQSVEILLPVAGLVGYFLGFWLAVAGVIVLAVLAATHTINWARLKGNFTLRRLLPYGVSVLLFVAAYLFSKTTLQFSYAIPIAFVVSGVLVIRGLKKFAVTMPALVVLLVSMLVLGCVAAGPGVVTDVSENHVITMAQIPSIDAINITARSVEGAINLYFNDNSSQACEVQFVKQYGVVTVGSGESYNGQSAYDNEPASIFYYSVTNGELYVISDSFSTLMNITVNENLIGNFSLYSYFGDLSANVPPNVNTVDTLNLTSVLGNLNLKISNTANLAYAWAQTNNTIQADVTSTMQNQDATVVLNGGTVNLNVEVTNVQSQILCYQTSQWGTIQANTHGFTVLNKSNSFFNAQTPNYDSSPLKRLDVNATTSTQSININANYNGG